MGKIRKWCVVSLMFLLLLLLSGCGCKHTETTIKNAKTATCIQEGYTGDVVCTACEKVIESGEAIACYPHLPTITTPEKSSTCLEKGYTACTACMICGTVLEESVELPLGDHQPGETEYAKAPSCEQGGYSGDVYCSICQTLLREGEYIPDLGGHSFIQENAMEATCIEPGYSGDLICDVCQYIQEGERIPARGHTYVEHICSVCSWPEPGLYQNGKFQKSWNTLLNLDQIAVTKRTLGDLYYNTNKPIRLLSVDTDLEGTLVIADSIDEIAYNVFHGNQGIREIYMKASTFENSFSTDFNDSALEQLHLQGTLKSIWGNAFIDCTQLRSIDSTDELTEIHHRAFIGCTSLREFSFSETLTFIGENAFAKSGLREVVLPSSLEKSGGAIFQNCADLLSADYSRTQLTEIYGNEFSGCTSLQTLHFPHGLKTLNISGIADTAIVELNLPAGFQEMRSNDHPTVFPKNLQVVRWPVSFLDEAHVMDGCPVQTIYYEGTEQQWMAMDKENAFPGAVVIFEADFSQSGGTE